MRDPELDQAFARFRRRGDAAALGEVFDGVAPELVRLARHLVGDAAEAEDLVQATFLTAIERAHEFDDERALVPWLVGILAKHAANLRRARGRRAADALGEREPEEVRPGPVELAEQRELRGALEGALARLPETYRAVLGEFLLEGHAPREIARARGLSSANARVRVHRGLELLRRALPASVATGAAVVLSGRRGLADVRARVLVAAREAGPALAGAGTIVGVTGGILGGMLVPKTVLVTLAALLALALAWWRRSEGGPLVAGGAPVELAASVPVRASELEPLTLAPASGPGRALALAEAELVHALGRVVEYRSGAPVGGARVWSTPDGAGARIERATVAADGSLEFDLPRAELETLFVEADGFAPVAVPSTEQRRARFWEEAGRVESDDGNVVQLYELRLQRGTPLVGRVLDERGHGVAGAELGLLGQGFGLEVVEERRVGRSGPGGEIVADGLVPPARQGETWLLYAVHPEGFGVVELGRQAEEAGAPVELVLLPRRALRLTVLDAEDLPVAGAWVALFPLRSPFHEPSSLMDERFLPLPPLLEGLFTAHTDAAGVARLRVPGPPSTFQLSRERCLVDVWRGGRNLAREVLELGAEGVLHLPGGAGRALTGRVLRAAGEPAPGSEVALVGAGTRRSTTSAADGAFELAFGPEDGLHLVLEAERDGARAVRSVDLERGAPCAGLELVLREPRTITGTVRGEDGRPCAGVWVFPHSLEGIEASLREPRTDDEGRFRLEGLSEGEYELTLAGAAGELEHDFERFRPVRVRGGDTDIELVLPLRREAPCTLLVRARRAGGAAAPIQAAAMLPASETRAWNAPLLELADGGARFLGLEPGRHEVWAQTAAGMARGTVELTRAGEERTLELEVGAPSSLHVRVELGGLALPERAFVTGQAASASASVPGQLPGLYVAHELAPGEREFDLHGLCPGPWRFAYLGQGLSPRTVELELVPGADAELELRALPGVELSVDASAWRGVRVVELELLDEAGHVLSHHWLDPERRLEGQTTVDARSVAWRARAPRITGTVEGRFTPAPDAEAPLVLPAPPE